MNEIRAVHTAFEPKEKLKIKELCTIRHLK